MSSSKSITSLSEYLAVANGWMTLVVLAHIPAALGIAWYFDNGLMLAAVASCVFAAGPAISCLVARRSVATSILVGVSLMCFSALFIHLSGGMIEMHFHILVFLAILIVFASPWPVLIAAVTVAIHHVSFYFLLPKSIFNYQASFGIVILHAVFVVIEAVPVSIIAANFGKFIGSRGSVMLELLQLSNAIQQTSQTSAHISNSLSTASNDQASAIQQTMAAVEEVKSMTARTAQNAQETLKAADSSKDAANEGNNAVALMQEAIDDISTSNGNIIQRIAENNQQLEKIVQIISDIGAKTKVINDIVFQTRLLSFNASVEAARAGEHGKGFAVVAEEVGNLAQMSGKAAHEISQLLEESIKKVQSGAEETGSFVEKLTLLGKEKIQAGTVRAKKCSEVLNSILSGVAKVNSLVSEITSACEQQSQTINEISSTINSVGLSTQSTAATSKETASTANQLKSQADALEKVVRKLASGSSDDGSRKVAVSNENEPFADSEFASTERRAA